MRGFRKAFWSIGAWANGAAKRRSAISFPAGFFLGGVQTLPFTIINQIAGKGNIAKALSLYSQSSYLGKFLSGFLLGFVIQEVNTRQPLGQGGGYVLMYFFSSAMFLIAFFGLLIWKKKLKER